jgi:threonine/homoserine/homoserine lactone efflux protein
MMGVLLAGVHDVECLIWFSVLIAAIGIARAWLRGGRAQRVLDRVTGSVLIGFGLKLALSEH